MKSSACWSICLLLGLFPVLGRAGVERKVGYACGDDPLQGYPVEERQRIEAQASFQTAGVGGGTGGATDTSRILQVPMLDPASLAGKVRFYEMCRAHVAGAIDDGLWNDFLVAAGYVRAAPSAPVTPAAPESSTVTVRMIVRVHQTDVDGDAWELDGPPQIKLHVQAASQGLSFVPVQCPTGHECVVNMEVPKGPFNVEVVDFDEWSDDDDIGSAACDAGGLWIGGKRACTVNPSVDAVTIELVER